MFDLEVISHLDNFKNKSFLKYLVEGIDTIGVWNNEPFEIKFHNKTYEKVQIKISLDGTDVLTGKLADTDPNGDMWVVAPRATLSLKAWAESDNGGAQFVFTNSENGVATHTHGNTSSKGIIAAAVYKESYVAPYINYNFTSYNKYNKTWDGILRSNDSNYLSRISDDISDISDATSCKTSSNSAQSLSLQSLNEAVEQPSIGAGEYVNQKIAHVKGLIKPELFNTLRVRYLWWDSLKQKLQEGYNDAPHSSGFPGDKQRAMSLGSTPRLSGYNSPKKQEQNSFSRF